jgi:large subunit ribosomal protein L32
MTPLPKKKTAHARQGERRAHMALEAKSLVKCPQCSAMKLPHHACPNCGTYDGREVVAVKAPKKKSS